jgi:hypothetical protein
MIGVNRVPKSTPASLRAHRIQRLVFAGLGLALLTAVAYLLMGWRLLGVGGLDMESEAAEIPFVAAGGYLLGGFLILVRRRWLWILGAIINALVIWMFFSLHAAEPVVLLSAGGLISKALQAALEVVLIWLIVGSWRRVPQSERSSGPVLASQ